MKKYEERKDEEYKYCNYFENFANVATKWSNNSVVNLASKSLKFKVIQSLILFLLKLSC